MDIKRKLTEQIAEAGRRMQQIMEKVNEEKRTALTEDEAKEFDKWDADYEGCKKQLSRIERVAEATAAHEDEDKEIAGRLGKDVDQVKVQEKSYLDAFWAWACRGKDELTPEQRAILKPSEKRAQTITTTGGGHLIPQGFMRELEVALKAFGGVREVAKVIRTQDGAPLMWPMIDATGRAGRWLGINTASTTTDLTYGQTQYDAYIASSDTIKVPIQLSEDAFELQQHLLQVLSETIGRLENIAFTTGNGSGRPTGFVTDATSAFTSAAGTSITMSELVKLEHAVDAAYRRSPSCVYMLHDSSIRDFKQLSIVSGDSRPVWQPGFIDGTPATINGFKYVVNNDMDAIAVTKKPIAFGDFSKYIIRDSMDFVLKRFDELYAEALQVGFHAFHRTDGKLLNAGQNPIQFITAANT